MTSRKLFYTLFHSLKSCLQLCMPVPDLSLFDQPAVFTMFSTLLLVPSTTRLKQFEMVKIKSYALL